VNPLELEAVRQEAAAVYRFVDSLVKLCNSIGEYPVYTKPSHKFFAYVKLLGLQTQQFLFKFPDQVNKNAKTAYSKRRKLFGLRTGWETIHGYLKPALDADTLHLPTPLMFAFQDLVSEVDALEPIEFTVFHSAEVNYLQIPAETFREVANGIADLIKGQHFPNDLGLIGMPYSQASGFFLNCLLPHEMGHFIYQEIFFDDIESEIDKALERMEDEIKVLDDLDIAFCRDMLARWVEEIFCDLFAICLIGPAYSFALIELTGAMLLVEQPVTMLDDFYFFIEDHPAEISRFNEHVKMLTHLGWWQEVANFNCPSVQVLSMAVNRREEVHIKEELPAAVTEERMLACYREVLEWLISYVSTKVPHRPTDITDFVVQSPVISEYFREAVVPSTIIVNGAQTNPRTVVLINSAFRFYSESLPSLIMNVAGGRSDSVEDRSKFTERLELWALKSIEDSRLLEKQLS
jgi:hypothetical protein